MNILFLTFWYPSPTEPYKGIFVKEYAKAIKSAGISITVLALNLKNGAPVYKKYSENFIDENNIPTHIITIESRFYKKIYALIPLLNNIITTYIRKNNYLVKNADIIHSNIIAPCGIIGYWLSKKYSIPHIISEQWSKIDKFMRLNIYAGAAKKAYSESLCITALSGFLEKKIQQYVPVGKKIVIVPNVVDTALFYYKSKNKTNTLSFTAVATWKPPKLPHLFINALDKVSAQTNKKIQLNMVGLGSQSDEFKKIAGKLNYKLNLLGSLKKEQIAELLFDSDYFLHASEVETFSAVVAEALCSGTPVIASNVGALPELVKPLTNGVLCINTTEEWVKGINKALSTEFNNKSISAGISQRVSLKQVGIQFLSVYNLLGKS